MKKCVVLATVLAMILTTGWAQMANAMQRKEEAKKAVVLAVFGTSYPQALKAIVHLRDKASRAFPGMPVKIAFTSEIIRTKWQHRATDRQWRQMHPDIPEDIYAVKNPLATIADLQNQGYRSIAVQSTHIFAGEEFENLKAEVQALAGIHTLKERDKPFKVLFLGRPALGEPGDRHPYAEDIQRAADVLKIDVAAARMNASALVYMGHGNEVFSTGAYVELEAALRESSPGVPVFVGTVEGFPPFENVLERLRHANIRKVTLIPLMVVAGDHARNDMAGADDDSWKRRMENAGIQVVPVLRGLGELDAWADIYIDHLRDAMTDYGF